MEYNSAYNLIGSLFMLILSAVVLIYPIKTFTAIGRFYRKFSKRALPFSPPDSYFEIRPSFSIWIRLLAVLVGGSSLVSIILNMSDMIKATP